MLCGSINKIVIGSGATVSKADAKFASGLAAAKTCVTLRFLSAAYNGSNLSPDIAPQMRLKP